MKQSRALKPMVQTLFKKSAVPPRATFPLAILKRCSFSMVHAKGFMVSLMDETIFSKWWQFCFTRCNLSSSEISSLLVIPSSSNNFDKILVRIEWLCAQRCRADIELVSDIMPLRWQAASAFTVCSKVRLIGILENGFDVRFSEKQPFLNSSWMSGWEFLSLSNLSWYTVSKREYFWWLKVNNNAVIHCKQHMYKSRSPVLMLLKNSW